MTKISLISPFFPVTNTGLRIISSVLHLHGFTTQMIFMPLSDNLYQYPEKVLDQLRDITARSSVIGLSLMDNFLQRGIQISQALKTENNFIIWGGTLATMDPDIAHEHADAACIGDGEHAFLEFMENLRDGKPLDNIINIWLKDSQYPQLEYIKDITSLPLPDYGPEDHFCYDVRSEELIPIGSMQEYEKILEPAPQVSQSDFVGYSYRMITTRGCPHNCTYCGNNLLKKLQCPKLRFASLQQIEDELEFVRNNFPNVKHIRIADDNFLARKDVRDIARIFKQHGYTFRCLMSPPYFTQELMRDLIDCGLDCCQLGLQSKAPRMEELYHRRGINQNIDSIFEFFNKNNSQIPLQVDVMVNNPWERTKDTLYTIDYLLDKLPLNGQLFINSLVFFKGTELYKKAANQGILDQYQDRNFDWKKKNYIYYTTILLALLSKKGKLSRGLLRLLSRKSFVYVMNNRAFVRFLYPLIIRNLRRFRQMSKKIHSYHNLP